ncbi:MAG: hypothetical protein KGL63_01340 [Betaproteobacteria bacterium]|nr:hypothetical protein [Betaproteobacteria bacterium]
MVAIVDPRLTGAPAHDGGRETAPHRDLVAVPALRRIGPRIMRARTIAAPIADEIRTSGCSPNAHYQAIAERNQGTSSRDKANHLISKKHPFCKQPVC